MAIYLKKFETQAAYEAAQSGLILPNVSLTVDNNTVHYNPSTPPTPPIETRVVCKYNVTSTSSPTQIGYYDYISGFSAIEIDGVMLDELVTEYTFDTIGEHTVKYTLTDPTTISDGAFYYCTSLTSINIPSGVTSISDSAFYTCTSLTSIDIPSGVTSIGEYAFEFCESLTSIDIPDSVTSIGISAFGCCPIADEDTRNAIRAINPDAFYCD